jgi:hypothetical protein
MTDISLLTEKESAKYQRRSQRTLARERSEGRGCRYVRIGSRIFYRKSDLDAFIAAHVRGGEDRDQRAAAA